MRTKMMGRLTEPRPAPPRRRVAIGVAVGIAAGIAMMFIAEPLGPLAGRMREALG